MNRFAILSLAGALAASAAAQTGPDSVVARAGSETVTRGALTRHLLRYYGKNGIEQLIDRSVLSQEAARYKINVSEADVDARMGEIRKLTALKEAMEREGYSEAAIRDQVRFNLMGEKLLVAKWPVKDSDLTRLTFRYARLQTRNVAREVIQEARRGVDFRILVGQRSDDKENGGLVEDLMRIDRPAMYRLAWDAIQQQGLRIGQVTREPIEAAGSYVVIKLEKISDAKQLTPAQRKQAEARIYASRAAKLLEASRKRYRITYPTALAELAEKAEIPPDVILARIAPAGTAAPEEVTGKKLVAHLYRYPVRSALEQLIDRSLVSQEGRRAGLTVSEGEITARKEQSQKAVGIGGFQKALDVEGISEELWRERLRYVLMAEKIVDRRMPVRDEDLQRLVVRYIRVGSKLEAAEIIREAAGGVSFDQLRMRSLDKGDGFIRPRQFLRSDHPELFREVTDSKVAMGQLVPRPVEVGGSWLVLRFEARFGPDTMTVQERDQATRRLRAVRMDQVMEDIRKTSKVEYVIPVKNLADAAG